MRRRTERYSNRGGEKISAENITALGWWYWIRTTGWCQANRGLHQYRPDRARRCLKRLFFRPERSERSFITVYARWTPPALATLPEICNSLSLPALHSRNTDPAAALTVYLWIGRSWLLGVTTSILVLLVMQQRLKFQWSLDFLNFVWILDVFLLCQISTCFVGLLGTGLRWCMWSMVIYFEFDYPEALGGPARITRRRTLINASTLPEDAGLPARYPPSTSRLLAQCTSISSGNLRLSTERRIIITFVLIACSLVFPAANLPSILALF